MSNNNEKQRKRRLLQGEYNMDDLLHVYSTMSDEHQELENRPKKMIVSSVNYLYNDSSIFDHFPMPIGLVIQPFEYDSFSTLRIDQEPVRCENCNAIASYISEFETNGNWKCSFCKAKSSIPYNNVSLGKTNRSEEIQDYCELSKNAETVEYLNGTGCFDFEYTARADLKAVIFLIDKSLSSEHFKNIQQSLSIILNNDSLSNYYIGLIVFGDVIEIYEMGGNIGEADIFSASQLPTEFVCSWKILNVISRTSNISESTSEKVPTVILKALLHITVISLPSPSVTI